MRTVSVLLAGAISACAPAPPNGPNTVPSTPLTEWLDSIVAKRGAIVVAHRGDSGSHPENTLPAFDEAVRLGADLVELDFRQTSDGVLVCFHDRNLDRTTDSVARGLGEKRDVASTTLSELQQLDAGAWKAERFAGTRVPMLRDALEVIQTGSITMIEHKAGSARTLVQMLRASGALDRVLVQSFDWNWLEELHALEPSITIAALGGTEEVPEVTPELLADIARTGASMVHWNHKRLTRPQVELLKQHGYSICVYTVNDVAGYDRMIELGVDAIATDEPERMIRHLRSR